MNERLKEVCCIVGAGDFEDNILQDSFVIAADGGLDYLSGISIAPDVIIGDFDSLSEFPQQGNIVQYPSEKDYGDMMLAVRYGLDLGYRTFHLYGALGGSRVSHTLANIQLLAFICENGAQGCIYGKNTLITAVKDGEIQFDESHKGFISIYSHTDVSEGVCMKGVKYEMEKGILKNDTSIGLSNEFTGKPVTISVKKGTLIIIIEGQSMI